MSEPTKEGREFCVWDTVSDILHRGPWDSRDDADAWIRGASAAGVPSGKFVVKARWMMDWSHVDD